MIELENMPKQYVSWQEDNGDSQIEHQARWLSQSNYAIPKRIVIVDDTTTADDAYRLANAGTSMLWRGDFNNAKQLLKALDRRIERTQQRKTSKKLKKSESANKETNNIVDDLPNLFHQHRQAQSQRARLLSRLLLQLDTGYISQLRRAPDFSSACKNAFGEINEPCMLSFRDLQGAMSADQWRKRGVDVKGVLVDGSPITIYPHFGVFAPTRQEYVKLLLDAPMPAKHGVAYDIGTGTGLLAIILANRGFKQIIATDVNSQALACAEDNITRLGFDKIKLQQTDLFPKDAPPADLIVCNPPWLPAKPSSPLEYAVYDAGSNMLRGFLKGAKQHLAETGEVWLILSDLAEHLKLRTRADLLDWIEESGLSVKYRLDTQPTHPRSQDKQDLLWRARSAEVTSLWCLA